MKEIENRDDVRNLVYTFYDKIRDDELLGPVFNSRIKGEEWGPHLEKMTDFWETNLFGIPKFRGNPMMAHHRTDMSLEEEDKITQLHFAQWLRLWYQTVNELFEGDLAFRARDTARRMSTPMFVGLWSLRPENRIYSMY